MVWVPLIQNWKQMKTQHLVCPHLNKNCAADESPRDWPQPGPKARLGLDVVLVEVLDEEDLQISWMILFPHEIYHPKLIEVEVRVDVFSTSTNIYHADLEGEALPTVLLGKNNW